MRAIVHVQGTRARPSSRALPLRCVSAAFWAGALADGFAPVSQACGSVGRPAFCQMINIAVSLVLGRFSQMLAAFHPTPACKIHAARLHQPPDFSSLVSLSNIITV